jgi:hypothetical protein
MVYKAMSHVTLPHMRELSPTPTLVAKLNGGYFLNSPRISGTENFEMGMLCSGSH